MNASTEVYNMHHLPVVKITLNFFFLFVDELTNVIFSTKKIQYRGRPEIPTLDLNYFKFLCEML